MTSLGLLDQVSVLHMRYFLTVLDAGTVRAASERIGISQPSLSQQIARLEHRLGVRLFTRTTTGMESTDDGERLAATITPMLLALRRLGNRSKESMRIGVPRGFPSSAYQVLRSEHRGDLEFQRVDSSRALAAIGSGRIDAAVVRGPLDEQFRAIEVKQLLSNPLGLLVSPGNRLAVTSRVTWAELKDQRLLWFDDQRSQLFASMVLDNCHVQGWIPELVRLDPAGSAMTEDVLRNSDDLVALRPKPEALPSGIIWREMRDPIYESFYIVGTES